ncbi:hypothetical protein [Phenylobacterium sp.]|jgi:hypothetical protein|uniref:hypothetical protein n=1 Tax=Phenylobacterium sp. TaxID=1871053 RepID=UPI002E2F12D2|nr:hypothetical protein [Phenylobacterium sp.]HEX2561540.1 hypothetical protein [Phenylobacterium sp.]
MKSWPNVILVAALTAAFAVASCERQDTQAPAEEVTTAPAPNDEGPWRLEASATAGSALVFSDGDGIERLRLVCRRGPAEFVAQAADVQPIGSEERFTLGVGETLFTLVADVSSGLPFVEAKAPLSPALIAALGSGQPIAANYGATNLGPHPPPQREVRDAFIRACEQALTA